ncbi:STAS domain-containing protein [Geodermatophilus sp. DF01-2]|uniref:SpoIIE family protein phosphatase n=1 Tax=Geodermatophilus sp. DF01-2 TaxID=2559610 RepID=UPI001073E25E|nr:SpoIIE family protein phosphatase [Geodermatophilus sp. DF01_2]TFV55689.1 STAS domain-containing protein [Geodermatophilus sp. DF01_2]
MDRGEELTRRVGDADVVRGVFDQMPMIMAVYAGPQHTVVAANEALRTFFGRDEFVGLPIREALPELAGQHVYEILDEVYATGRTQVAREWRLQVDPGRTGVLQEVYLDFHMAPARADDGRVTGVLTYAADVTEQVRARQAAQEQAAEAERRYRDARDVVTALQEALLPTALPVLPGARIAARYLVAEHDQVAGGDWFDAIPCADGAVALVVGDVVGHGVAASAAMGQLRAVLGDALATGCHPVEALSRADAFAARTPSLHATTLALVVLDPATGRLCYSSCGQPPPLVVGADGSTRFLPGTGNGPLGTGTTPTLAVDTLAPGELVLLYSDGLVERPHRTIGDGMAELAKVAADAAANRALPLGAAPTPTERVCQLTVELLTRTGYDDDVTTLAAYRLTTPTRDLDVEVPTTRSSLRQLRQQLDDWLDRLDPTDADRDALTLAVWEAIANAVDHAYPPGQPGPVRLEAALHAGGVVECRISDQGRWRPPDPGVTHRGRGLLLAERLIDFLRVDHPSHDDAPDGPRGTVVTLRHRLYRPAMLASAAGAQPAAPALRPPFAVDADHDSGSPRLRVRGPIDIATAEEFGRRLSAASRGGVLPLTVDLTDVTHLASAGVQTLHRMRDQLAAHQQELVLVAPPGSPAHAVLEIVHLPHTGR